MAPNRKQLWNSVDPLVDATTTPLVQAKYLPLTHPSETEAETLTAPSAVETSSSVEAKTEAAAVLSSNDYWNWPSDGGISKEQQKGLFSATHLEANLIQQAQKQTQTRKTCLASSSSLHANANHDNYWAERVEARLAASVSPDDSYWYWPEETEDYVRDVHIAMILKEEFARQQVSAETIQQQLVAQAQKKNIPSKAKAETDSYWEWKESALSVPLPKTTTVYADPNKIQERDYWHWPTIHTTQTAKEQQAKAKRIAYILQYEANRNLFSVQHMQDNLVRAAASSTEPRPNETGAMDHYWTWPTTSAQEVDDDYWNMRPIIYVPATASKGYWDW